MTPPGWIRWAWRQPGGAAELLLWPLSLLELLYRAGSTVSARRKAASARSLPVPVISVGNLAAGGTGKTPLTIHLAETLHRLGYRPGILSRGYGGSNEGHGPQLVADGNGILLTPAVAGDEPVLMAQCLPGVPVAVCARRILAGQLLLERAGADVLLLDDGFQHRELIRDADVVVVDGEMPVANGRLLPRGPLRESAGALARADLVVARVGSEVPERLTTVIGRHTDAAVVALRSVADGIVDGDGNRLTLPAGSPVAAFCGIGEPERFRATLREMQLDVRHFEAFADHACYPPQVVQRLAARAQASGVKAVLATRKDGVKVASGWPGPVPLGLVSIRLDPPAGAEAVGDVWVSRLMDRAVQRFRNRTAAGA
ncbi:MAG: tetraacyldisaccharide 4'-kinase [Nitrospirota bacterium]|nr:tetraacyldisaccharide 4'-kinase [Nitrospirota bacterium]